MKTKWQFRELSLTERYSLGFPILKKAVERRRSN